MLKDGKPTRAVFLIPETLDADGNEFITEAVKMGGKLFFSIANGQSCFYSPTAYKEEKPTTRGNYSGKIHLVLLQNQAAELLYPISSKALGEKLSSWANSRKVTSTYYPLSCKPQWTEIQQVSCSKGYPILRMYDRMAPLREQVHGLVSDNRMRKWIEDFNNADRLAMIAGFIPKSLHDMIRHHRPMTYLEDEKILRLKILEANDRTYRAYCSMKKRCESMLQDSGKKERKRKKPTGYYHNTDNQERKSKVGKFVARSNVDLEYQDQKTKKRK